jgi:hypothetical protein
MCGAEPPLPHTSAWLSTGDNFTFLLLSLLWYYWVSGLCPSPNISNRTQCFGSWVCFHPQVKSLGVPVQLGLLKEDNLSRCTTIVS